MIKENIDAAIECILKAKQPFKPVCNVDYLVPLDNRVLEALIQRMSDWEYYEQAHKIKSVLDKKRAGIYT
jgi:hypothetical protein